MILARAQGLFPALGIPLVALMYFAAAKFGFYHATVADQVTIIWPPSGLALAALLLGGQRLWPGVALGAFLSNIALNEPLLAAAGIAVGNTLEAVIGAALLQRYGGSVPYLPRVRDVLALVLGAATLSTAVSATIGVTSLCLAGLHPWAEFARLWLVWWVGDAGGVLIVAPLLLVWGHGPYPRWTRRQALEALLLVLLAGTAIYAVLVDSTLLGTLPFYPYWILPFIIWTAVSFRQYGATIMNAVIFMAALWGLKEGSSIFSDAPRITALHAMHVFCMITSFMGLVVGAAISEKDEAAQADRFLSSLVESSDECIIGKNINSIITTWNRGAERLFGFTAREAVGSSIYIIIPPEREDEERAIMARIRSGQRYENLETVRQRKDGQRIHVMLTISPIRDEAGTIVGASKIGHDITARVLAQRDLKAAHAEQQKLIGAMQQTEADLLRYTAELKRSNQELDDFAYVASHDLKEPLRGLIMQASFLQEDYRDKLDEEALRRLNRLSFLARRMEQLISDLLYFSRLGRAELAVQETDPNAIVADIRQLLDTFLRERNAQIIVPKPMPAVVCDRLRLGEIFRNLIVNGVKYNTSPERVVEVGYLPNMQSPCGLQHGVFFVRDNGIGIAPQFHDDIFRIFKRLDQVKGEEGTGAGLTFVKKIVERHGGQIWLDSAPGKGTTFYFTLGRQA